VCEQRCGVIPPSEEHVVSAAGEYTTAILGPVSGAFPGVVAHCNRSSGQPLRLEVVHDRLYDRANPLGGELVSMRTPPVRSERDRVHTRAVSWPD